MATAEQKLRVSEFTNEPFVDFSKAENRKAMEEALKKVAGEFGREYPMYIGGKRVTTSEKRASTNPSHPSQAIGMFQVATAEMAKLAVEAAHKAFDSWKRVPTTFDYPMSSIYMLPSGEGWAAGGNAILHRQRTVS